MANVDRERLAREGVSSGSTINSRAALGRTSLLAEFGLAPSASQTRASGGTTGILPAERAQATFDAALLTTWWDQNRTARRKFFESELPSHLALLSD